MLLILFRWVLNAIAVLITAYVLPGVTVSSFFVALVVAVVLGFLNAIVKPVLIFLTLPVTVLTLGLFLFIINALMILLSSAIVPGFTVRGFWWALLFSVVLSLVHWVLARPAIESAAFLQQRL